MSEMVERVARALEQFDLDGASGIYEDQINKAARAAIDAMREPTEGIIDACSEYAYEGWGDSRLIATQSWQAGIDAALK